MFSPTRYRPSTSVASAPVTSARPAASPVSIYRDGVLMSFLQARDVPGSSLAGTPPRLGCSVAAGPNSYTW